MKIENNISEPSMDEILASIRDIISTDIPEIKRDDESSILDLTHLLPEENQYAKHTPPESRLQPWETDTSPSKNPLEDSLISPRTIDETVEAFDSLSRFAQGASQRTPLRFPESAGTQTLDSLTREMLRPLLKEWLETHLPKIVRSIVNEQVERIMHQTSPAASSQRGHF